MVADDSPLARRWVAACLTLAGYDVISASDGEDARDKTLSEMPDLIVLDVVLPRLKPRDILRELRQSSKSEAIPVVLMVPEGLPVSEIIGDDTGYDALLYKPVNRVDLLAVVHSLLERGKRVRGTLTTSKIVAGLGGVLEALDPRTREHSERVGEYAYRLGSQLGLSPEERQALRNGAFLHDIGKVSIGETILSKPASLTDEEQEKIKDHPSLGTRILEGFGGGEIAEEAIRYHHERWDGMGYPDRLEGNEIPLNARILTVVDAYDVLLTGRPYQKAVSPGDAAAVLRQERGKHFDPEVVDTFLEMIRSEPGVPVSLARDNG